MPKVSSVTTSSWNLIVCWQELINSRFSRRVPNTPCVSKQEQPRGDPLTWLHDLKHTYSGDANLDREFSSQDFVLVFASGKYETDQQATWVEGDWDGDAEFTSADMVIAFQDGGYEMGPRRPSTNAAVWPTGCTSNSLNRSLPILSGVGYRS